VPLPECRTADASVLVLRDARKDGRDLLRWRWKGSAVSPQVIGDPLRTDHMLCLYDAHSGSQVALLAASAPGGGRCGRKPCWRLLDGSGFRYRDRLRTPHGLDRIVLRGPGAQLRVVGKGARLATPSLPLQPPVVVQLVTASGACWQASYARPISNSTRLFKARLP
jgi:hypothetical protein